METRNTPTDAPTFGRTSSGIGTVRYPVVHSTNDAALDAIRQGTVREPSIYIANQQTAGRGRTAGRIWASPSGGLWFTLAAPLPTDLPGTDPRGELGLRAGVATARVLQGEVPPAMMPRIKLKWPNDVLFDRRKLAGILAQTASHADGSEWIALGVGINANNTPEHLPSDLRRPAASLAGITGSATDLDALAESLGRALLDATRCLTPWSDIIHQANDMLYGIGDIARTAPDEQSVITGILQGLDDRGTPVIETTEGSHTLHPGHRLVLADEDPRA